jgi:hypothetical protein
MSGGYIQKQEEGEHQIVVFTFIGPVSESQVKEWNRRVVELKQMFVNPKVPSYLAGITIKGQPTPDLSEFLPKKKKKKKK